MNMLSIDIYVWVKIYEKSKKIKLFHYRRKFIRNEILFYKKQCLHMKMGREACCLFFSFSFYIDILYLFSFGLYYKMKTKKKMKQNNCFIFCFLFSSYFT